MSGIWAELRLPRFDTEGSLRRFEKNAEATERFLLRFFKGEIFLEAGGLLPGMRA